MYIFVDLIDLAVDDVRDGAVLFKVNVESVGLEVSRDHHAGLDDAGLFGELALAKGLTEERDISKNCFVIV